MTITHIVMFEFHPHVSSQQIEEVCERMLALQHLCLRKRTSGSKDVEGKGDGNGEGEGERYILNATGGRQNSGEENRVNYTHGFILEFSTQEDRTYYLEEDSKHLEFVRSLEGVVRGVGVFDFTPGGF